MNLLKNSYFSGKIAAVSFLANEVMSYYPCLNQIRAYYLI